MAKIPEKFALALAVTSLMIAPVGAQANTRAGDNASFYTSAQLQPGVGRPADGESLSGNNGDYIGLFLAGLWLTGIIVIVADLDDSNNDNQSPGAN